MGRLQHFVRQQRRYLAQVVVGVELTVDSDRRATTGSPDHLECFEEHVQQTAKIGPGELQSCFAHFFPYGRRNCDCCSRICCSGRHEAAPNWRPWYCHKPRPIRPSHSGCTGKYRNPETPCFSQERVQILPLGQCERSVLSGPVTL